MREDLSEDSKEFMLKGNVKCKRPFLSVNICSNPWEFIMLNSKIYRTIYILHFKKLPMYQVNTFY